jgi:hypothetical protein
MMARARMPTAARTTRIATMMFNGASKFALKSRQ